MGGSKEAARGHSSSKTLTVSLGFQQKPNETFLDKDNFTAYVILGYILNANRRI